jgi:hypothetical protein
MVTSESGIFSAPLAQLDRATVFGTVGCRFEPCRVQTPENLLVDVGCSS